MDDNKSESKSSSSKKLSMEIKRQYSYTTLARLIGVGDKPQSPVTPSPEGAVQMKRVVERLEEIDRESRELLQSLFSMLEKDARLERYIRKRIQDPKVSRMWELVERILSTHNGPIDLDSMVANNISAEEEEEEEEDEDENEVGSNLVVERGLKRSESSTEEQRNERFKIRTLDTSADAVVEEEKRVGPVKK